MTRLLLLLRRVRRRLLVHRRLLAALFAGAAVLIGLRTLAPPPPPTTEVWTASRPLPAGHVITREDLRRVAFAPGSVPASVATPDDLIGRAVAAPVVRGAPLSPGSVVGEELAAQHPGLVAVPVRLGDPDVAALLRVGDRVDVLASRPDDPDQALLLARKAVVLALPRAANQAGMSGLPGRLVVLGVTTEAGEKLVTAGVSAFVTVIWSR